jgi:hypothetical protein
MLLLCQLLPLRLLLLLALALPLAMQHARNNAHCAKR